MTSTPGKDDLLVVIDVQNDFCPGGNLAVPKGDEVVPLINRLAGRFESVVLTQDWHPRGHQSFASSHPGKKPFETTEAFYGTQVLWPDHCVQETAGAAFHKDLAIGHATLVIRKGFHKEIDSYSAFFENDHKTPTGFSGYLRERGIRRLTFVGLALDFCVRFSAEDARRQGFEALVFEAATRAIDLNGSLAATHKSFAERGVMAMPAAWLG